MTDKETENSTAISALEHAIRGYVGNGILEEKGFISTEDIERQLTPVISQQTFENYDIIILMRHKYPDGAKASDYMDIYLPKK
jgi:hypothetical protein